VRCSKDPDGLVEKLRGARILLKMVRQRGGYPDVLPLPQKDNHD
jgi:hypothetical protein